MDPTRFGRLAFAYGAFPGARVLQARITPESVEEHFAEQGVPAAFEVLNLDLDSYDLWVAAALLRSFRPDVVHVWGLPGLRWLQLATFPLQARLLVSSPLPSARLRAAPGLLDRWLLGQAAEGRRVEIGCAGGHGRTGTTLAGLLVLQGQSARSAIRRIRRTYCAEAIESREQEAFVRGLAR